MFGWPVWLLAVAVLIGIIGLIAIHDPAQVDAAQFRFYLDCPTTEVKEGDSVDVFLVLENPSINYYFYAYWHTDAGTADSSDYANLDNVYQRSRTFRTEGDLAHNRMTRTIQTMQDSEIEGTETFLVRFTPTSRVSDPGNPARDEKCEITIVDDEPGPTVQKIDIVSSPERGDTYGAGEVIEIAATFNQDVDVDGAVLMGLYVGDRWEGAWYQSGSGTRKLVFGYEVKPADRDDDGIHMVGGYVDSSGRVHGFGGDGTIKAKGTGVERDPVYTGLGAQAGHKVNGQPYVTDIAFTSSPAQGDSYGEGEAIQVSINFDQEVDAGNGVFAILRMGGIFIQRQAPYVSGSGTDTLVFEYMTKGNDGDDNGVSAFLPHGRDIRAKGTNVAYQPNPGGETPVLPEQSGHKVDGRIERIDRVAPTISSVSIISEPGKDSTYGNGDWISVIVTFSENVTVTGAPQLELDFDDTAKAAEYQSVTGAAALFAYKVQGSVCF